MIRSIALLCIVFTAFSSLCILQAQTTQPALPSHVFREVLGFPAEKSRPDHNQPPVEQWATLVSSANFLFAQGRTGDGFTLLSISPEGKCSIVSPDHIDRITGARIWRETRVQLHPEALEEFRKVIAQSNCLAWPVYHSSGAYDGTQQIISITTKNYRKVMYFDNSFPDSMTALFTAVEAIVLNPKNSDPQSSELIKGYGQVPESVWDDIRSTSQTNAATQPDTQPTTQP